MPSRAEDVVLGVVVAAASLAFCPLLAASGPVGWASKTPVSLPSFKSSVGMPANGTGVFVAP